MQGDFLPIHIEEQIFLIWKSFMWDIPQGVLKFAINAGINTLSSAKNLKRWQKEREKEWVTTGVFAGTLKRSNIYCQIAQLP